MDKDVIKKIFVGMKNFIKIEKLKFHLMFFSIMVAVLFVFFIACYIVGFLVSFFVHIEQMPVFLYGFIFVIPSMIIFSILYYFYTIGNSVKN